MRKIVSILIITIMILGAAGDKSYASVSEAAVLFLRIAAGARAAGMGEAFVAVADDATATHWNPAGLGTYPMASKWFDIKVPQDLRPLKKIAILKNDESGQNYQKYDIWALTDQGLVRYSVKYLINPRTSQEKVLYGTFLIGDKSGWSKADVIDAGADQTAESILRQYLNLAGETADKKLPGLLEKAGRSNNPYGPERIDSLKDAIVGSLGEGYKGKFEFDTAFTTLHDAYNLCLIDWENFSRASSDFRNAMKDSAISQSEADRILFSLEKSKRRVFPDQFIIPFNMVFDGDPTDLTCDENNLWVGTTAGLYRFNGKNWQRFGANEGLPSENIQMVKVSNHKLYIGTEFGLSVYDNGAVTYYGEPTGLPQKAVVSVTARADNDVWALVDDDLYHYDGALWKNYYEYNDVLGETDSSLYAAMKIYDTPAEKEKYLAKFSKLNVAVLAPPPAMAPVYMGPTLEQVIDSMGVITAYRKTKAGEILVADSTVTPKSSKPGKLLKIPYTAGFAPGLTSLEADDHQGIWVGSDQGLIRFAGRKWTRFGYRDYKAPKEMTVDQLALERTRGDSTRAKTLADNIRKVNDLTSDTLAAGQTVKIYSNPAGAKINQIMAMTNRVFFATDRGTIQFDGRWSRYNYEDLGGTGTLAVEPRDTDMWFVTGEQIKIRAGAMSELVLMHVNWLPELANDIYYEFASYVRSVEGWGTVGGNITFLTYGNIQRTDEQGTLLGEFSAFDVAMTLSYGTALSRSLSGGVSAKIIYSHLSSLGSGREKGSGTSTGLALDVGILYRIRPRLSLGVAVTNLGPDISYIDVAQADPLPRNLAIGLGWKMVESNYNRLLLTIEANKSLVGLGGGFSEAMKDVILNGGAEYWYGSFIALRGGYIYDQEGEIKTPTFGFGLAYKLFQFDFAYIPSNDQVPLANTARFSLTVKM